jgi:hypothetical protein
MQAVYPVRVEGRLDPGLSRWLWLVKWILVIPHALVLAFLWLAFVVLSGIAFFGILFTGRYPRSIFAFNVGVLRWTWRVGFYAYGALGTDRYPPFTLAERPDYPATLDVAYPDHLSRGLVLVKWWLLAIPHYLLLAIFVGGGSWLAWQQGDATWSLGIGLIGVLVLIAAVTLLFRGRYPGGIFDLVLGLNRWVVRVAAYVGLMTDVYPPFRLDVGGLEPGQMTLAPPVAAPREREETGGWSAGRILLVVLGSLATIVSVGMFVAGVAGVVIDQTQRDADGFVMSPTEGLATQSYALVSESIDGNATAADWFLGMVRVRAESANPVFLGIGPAEAVDRYLDGVRRAIVVDGVAVPGGVSYRDREGGAPRAAPAEQGFWVASSSGPGEQTVTWAVEDGAWKVVAMNPDGSAGVRAEVSVGAELDGLLWFALGGLAVGVLVLLLGLGIIFAAIPRTRGSA